MLLLIYVEKDTPLNVLKHQIFQFLLYGIDDFNLHGILDIVEIINQFHMIKLLAKFSDIYVYITCYYSIYRPINNFLLYEYK